MASPYAEREHLLDLDSLSETHRLLAQALTILKPLTDNYALTPYKEAFNWHQVVDKLKKLSEASDEGGTKGRYAFPQTSFFVVVFRSRRPTKDFLPELYELDKGSHAEAMKSGGLLKYWYGVPNDEGRNLAT
jgi:hypothetical protein